MTRSGAPDKRVARQRREGWRPAVCSRLAPISYTSGPDAAGLLAETLDEEKSADQTLGKIAKSVKAEAAEIGGGGEDRRPPARAGRTATAAQRAS